MSTDVVDASKAKQKLQSGIKRNNPGNTTCRNVESVENMTSTDTDDANDPNASFSKSLLKETYTSEIQNMMHGLGDCSKPLLESALLIEEIVRNQMVSLLQQSAEIAASRCSPCVGLEDILFLMRKDKVKLARLFRYLSIKDIKAALLRGTAIGSGGGGPSLADQCGYTCETPVQSSSNSSPQLTKRVKLCYDFLSSIDQTGELLSVFDDDFFDEIKYQRNSRIERMTVNMNDSQYLRYFEARKSGFGSSKTRPNKFVDWLLTDNLVDTAPNGFAVEVLQYLAYETVAEIVDLSLLVKQDAERHKLDPVTCFISNKMQNPDYPMFNASGDMESSSAPQTAKSQSDETRQAANDQNKSTQSSPSAKRRKMEDGHCSQEIIQPHCCIRPEDIKEALRRYWTPKGPFSLLEKSECKSKLLCL